MPLFLASLRYALYKLALTERILSDISDTFSGVDKPESYATLYASTREPMATAFAYLHEALNRLAQFMNEKYAYNRHYNADASRELLQLIGQLEELKRNLSRIGFTVELDPLYKDYIDFCKKFLRPSGGSEIPADYKPFEIEKFNPIFKDQQSSIDLKSRQERVELKSIGEGAYANVSSFKDPEYGIKVARKSAKKDLSAQEIARFKQEFEIMAALDNPYVLSVYKYDEQSNSYTMEFCDTTLGQYISKNNQKLSFGWRKRIALQLLYGMRYLHSKGVLHRDLSANNILLKQYESGVAWLKLADFGLARRRDSSLTRTHSSIKGTHIDPTLDKFHEYTVQNDIFALGHLLNFILTGRQALKDDDTELAEIVARCVSHKLSDRYATVDQLIKAIEQLTAL